MESEFTRPRTIDIVFAAVVGVWATGATWVITLVAWFIEQYLWIQGLAMPAWGWPLIVWINAIAAGAPSLLLALLARSAVVRVIARTWTLAALCLGVMGSARAVPVMQNEIYLAVLTVAATVLATVAWLGGRHRHAGGPRRGSLGPDYIWWYAAAAGAMALVPWLWAGALGGAVETGLAIAAAGAVGVLLAALVVPEFAGGDPGSLFRGSVIGRLLSGLSVGVAFLLVGAGTGGSSLQLAAMLILPPLGFVAVALLPVRPAVAVLTSLAALGPLAFVEPDQTSLLLGLRDVGYWAAIAAVIAGGTGLVLGVIALWAPRHPPRTVRNRPWSRIAAPIAAGVAVATAAVVYPVAGHPGFFGERLFVVMKQQADLSGLAGIGNLVQRRTAVYRRLVDTANRTQASLRAKLRASGYSFTPYYLVNGIEVDAGPVARRWLSRRSDVDRVLYSPQIRPIPGQPPIERGHLPAPRGPQWNITMIHADQVSDQGDTGQGILIGSSDTGVDGTHPALAGSFRGGSDSWFDPAHHSRVPVDYNGHGTHTLGSALGSGGIGVAPGAKWIACVNLPRNLGNPADYLNCLQFMLAPFRYGGDPFTDGRPADAADIATNSWSCPYLEGCDQRSLKPAVDALTAAGIFVVAAAGNEGPRCRSVDDPPAIYPDTFTVGAVDQTGTVATFSSRGPVTPRDKPDVVAPGVDVVSALPGGTYGALDGTSMAAPHVAGVVALIWSEHPELRGNIVATADLLRTTAVPAVAGTDQLGISGTCGPIDQTGSGLVDANAAVFSQPLR